MNIRILIFSTLSIIFLFFGCKKEELYMEPAGLLLGASFEDQPSDLYSFSRSSQDYKFEWTSEEAFDGEKSLKIQAINSSNDFAFWSIRFFDFELNKPFKARIRVKTKGINGEGFAFNMFSRAKDGSASPGSATYQNQTTDGEWMTVETMLNPNPNDNVSYIDLYFLMLENTTGTVYFDKLEFFTD